MRLTVTCLLLAVITASSAAQNDAVSPLITPAMREQDPRLLRVITLREWRISIGELLQAISGISGIPLAAGARDGSADVTVCIICKDTRVYKVLNALWSSVSYRQGFWRWERIGEDGKWSYRITQPRGAQMVGPALRNWVQERYEANARRLMEAVESGDQAKKAAIEAIYGQDPEQEAPNHWQGRLWTDILAFKKALSPDQQTSLLRGGPPVTVPMEALPASSREHLLSLWRVATINNRRIVNGVELTEEPPATVRFQTRKYQSVPGLFLWVSSVGTPPGIGGLVLERAYRDHIRAQWMTRRDSADEPAMAREMKPASALKGPTLSLPDDPERFPRTQRLVRRLEEIAASAEIPLVVRLPEDDEDAVTGLEPVGGKTLREYWSQLWRLSLMVKWHDGVQIVSTETWPMEDPPVPLWFIRSLRAQAKPGKFIPLQTLMLAADSLTEKQLRRLKPEFPVMDAVANGRGILALLHHNPALAAQALKPEGVLLTNEVGEALMEFLPPQLAEHVSSGVAKRIALTIEEDLPPRQRERRIVFWLYGDEGRRIQGFGITEKPQPDPRPKK